MYSILKKVIILCLLVNIARAQTPAPKSISRGAYTLSWTENVDSIDFVFQVVGQTVGGESYAAFALSYDGFMVHFI
jgi:hypothetical protein